MQPRPSFIDRNCKAFENAQGNAAPFRVKWLLPQKDANTRMGIYSIFFWMQGGILENLSGKAQLAQNRKNTQFSCKSRAGLTRSSTMGPEFPFHLKFG